jgi:vacuolar-type H+-ATPase subunit H
VEKLERVLAAEESGRHVVAEARERAVAVRAAADVESREIVVRAAESARTKAAGEREKTLGKARDEASALAAEAEADREGSVAAARSRLAQVADAVAEAVRG